MAENADDSGCEQELLLENVETLEDLDDIIEATLNKLSFAAYPNPSKLQTKVRSSERKAKEVNRILNECGDKLQAFSAEVAKTEATTEMIVCASDSDDDVQVVDFKPSDVKPILPKPIVVTTGVPSPSQPTSNFYVTQSGGLATLTSGYHQSSTYPQLQTKSPLGTPTKQVDLALGMKLFGKKFNEIWYKGTLVDIIGKTEPLVQQRYKVKFDAKGLKVLTGMHIAYHDHPLEVLPVGSRIIAVYKDEDANMSHYAGIVAEPPSVRNNHRYLIFFDDGYAQYGTALDIHKVYQQSKNVWDDIHPDSQEFIRGYLQQYPERPMVRLQKGQIVKTEWNGRWWVARVQEVDASLVKMYFEADRRVEWIYRGSTRLEPLYTELANAEAHKLAGKGRRHQLNLKGQIRKPIVEYTRGVSAPMVAQDGVPIDIPQTIAPAPKVAPPPLPTVIPQDKKRSVAKKSTANKARQEITSASSSSGQEQWWEKKTGTAATAQATKDKSDVIDLDSEDALGERVGIGNIIPQRDRKQFVSHLCGNHCIKEQEVEMAKLKGHNPLLFPQLCGWERQITKQKNTGKRVVFYRSPCGRRMRDLEETDYFLMMTNSNLTIDYFCFDANLHTDTEYVPVKTFCDIKDLSYGKETVPISCVNGIDRQYPDYVEYSNQRIPAKGVKLNLDEDFLCACSCTDGCRDATKCECIQRTIAASKAVPSIVKENGEEVGFDFRRLKEPLLTGIYECNPRCKCDNRCWNRTAQHGLQLRLQVFKTEKRGWGLRCLDDIPEGGFICVYAGQLLTEQGANEDGQQYGDEYLAELDYIEVVERMKEGYESDANEDEGIAEESEEEAAKKDDARSDSTYSGERRYKRTQKPSKSIKDVEKSELSSKEKTEEWLSKLGDDSIDISDEEGSKGKKKDGKPAHKIASQASISSEKSDGLGMGLMITEPTSMNTDNIQSDDSEEDDDQNAENNPENPQPETAKDGKKSRLRRSTRSTCGPSRFHNLPDPKSQKPVSPIKASKAAKKEKKKRVQNIPTRKLFGEEFCYVMDAKSMGNLGRYLNHSCTPNAFVQNVFVDTHDVRFPWVAFFAYSYIRAGTELTWDYNYEVGSVPGKVLYCYCGSAECRGRLL